jgi:hypothetical protein
MFCPIQNGRMWPKLAGQIAEQTASRTEWPFPVKSIVEQEGPLMADPCSEEQMTSNNEKINDVVMNDWLELQEQAKLHDNQMKGSIPAKTNAGKWGPPKMGPNKQVSRKAPSHHGPAHSPKKEYGLGVKNQVTTMDMLKRSDMWIADSGASNHVIFSDKNCRNKRNATGLKHGIVGNSVLPKCELDIPCVHFYKDGAQVGEVIITDVCCLPEGNFNLFSVTRLQKKGWTLTGNADYIKLQKGGESLLFNIVINTPKGALYVGKFSGKGGDEVVGGATSKAPTCNIKKSHELLGHNNENDTRQMASHLGWTITRGPLGGCESCANAKARQKNMSEISTEEKATVINGRWFHDSSTLNVRKGEKGSSKIWDLFVDELTGIPFTGIYNNKNEFIESMCQRIQAQTARGYPVLIMRQDNAGENKKLENRLHGADWKLPVRMEYTAANTSEQNALVEVKFTYLVAKARAAMNAAEVPRNRRLEFFPEVIMTMTKLD